jgi:hypothetical protein
MGHSHQGANRTSLDRIVEGLAPLLDLQTDIDIADSCNQPTRSALSVAESISPVTGSLETD